MKVVFSIAMSAMFENRWNIHEPSPSTLPSGNLLQFAIEHGQFSSLIYP